MSAFEVAGEELYEGLEGAEDGLDGAFDDGAENHPDGAGGGDELVAPFRPQGADDVYVGGVKAIEDAKLDGSTAYYYGSGNGYVDAVDKLAGLSLILALDPGDPSAKSFTLHVRDGFAWCELADDNAGSPGTWTAGPITLTEAGENAGIITPAGTAYFHHRVNIPAGASPGALRLFTLRVRGLTI